MNDDSSAADVGGPTEAAADVSTLVRRIHRQQEKIRDEEEKIATDEGAIVRAMVRIGECLVELQRHAGRRWTKQLEGMGYKPRTASRYQKLGESWWAENGLNGSDSLKRLPTDLHKLEWLCRLKVEQLGDFLERVDCKRCNRARVIQAVKEVLDLPQTTRTRIGAAHQVKTVKRSLDRLETTLQGLKDSPPDAESLAQLRQLLAGGIDLLQAARDELDPEPAECPGG